MQVTVIKGKVERVFFHPVERMLYFKMEEGTSLHALRAGNGPDAELMLTKPGDELVIHARGGRIDKYNNVTMSGRVE